MLYDSGPNINEITLLNSIKILHCDNQNSSAVFAAFDGYSGGKINTLNSTKNSNEIVDQYG